MTLKAAEMRSRAERVWSNVALDSPDVSQPAARRLMKVLETTLDRAIAKEADDGHDTAVITIPVVDAMGAAYPAMFTRDSHITEDLKSRWRWPEQFTLDGLAAVVAQVSQGGWSETELKATVLAALAETRKSYTDAGFTVTVDLDTLMKAQAAPHTTFIALLGGAPFPHIKIEVRG